MLDSQMPGATFPREFKFQGIPMASAYKQCGNSVVVPVIKRIAEIKVSN